MLAVMFLKGAPSLFTFSKSRPSQIVELSKILVLETLISHLGDKLGIRADAGVEVIKQDLPLTALHCLHRSNRSRIKHCRIRIYFPWRMPRESAA